MTRFSASNISRFVDVIASLIPNLYMKDKLSRNIMYNSGNYARAKMMYRIVPINRIDHQYAPCSFIPGIVYSGHVPVV